MISHLHGLVFIHVPKCAGMAVEAVLGGLPVAQRPEQHFTGAQLKRYHPDAWGEYGRFAIVRHPAHRATSFVRFIRRYDPVWRRHLGHLSDDALLWDLLMSTNLLTTHSAAAMIPPDEVEVLRQEELDDAWPAFADRFGLPDRLPRRNAAPTPAPRLSPDLALAVAAVFAADHARFGYPLPEVTLADLDEPAQGRVQWARLRAAAWSCDALDPTSVAEFEAFIDALDLPPPWRARLDAARSALPLRPREARDVVGWSEAVHDHVNAGLGKPLWRAWVP
jgi:hypothetical protein